MILSAADVLCTILAAATACAVQRAQHVLLTAAISATVVFLFAVGHSDPLAAIEHRIETTLLGGAMALMAGWMFGILKKPRQQTVDVDVRL